MLLRALTVQWAEHRRHVLRETFGVRACVRACVCVCVCVYACVAGLMITTAGRTYTGQNPVRINKLQPKSPISSQMLMYFSLLRP